ncbi:MAG TPA: hypothetical protein VHZ76_08995, partial [Gammaproteobacteria bacterium]|nr:hypothetical protein [Gammaproteobacteria bacterium]
MNKNYPKYVALMLPFAFINPSFTMGGKVFKLARIVGVTTLPACGLYEAYKRDDFIKKSVFKDATVVTESALNDWFVEKKKELNIPNAGSISLVSGRPFGIWGTYAEKNGGKVMVHPLEKVRLNNALKNPLIKENDEHIASASMNLNHEFGHIVRQEPQNIKHAFIAIPVCVEAASFGVTKAFRILCNTQQQPK